MSQATRGLKGLTRFNQDAVARALTGRAVVTLVPVFIFGWFVEIPAVFYLGIWFVTQVFSGVASLGMPAGMGGVAWWAHIGGFLFGLLMAKPFCIGRCERQKYIDEYYPW